MDSDDNETYAERTVFPADRGTLTLSAWVTPPQCGSCGGRVDTFYRYNRPDDASCQDCSQEWKIKP